MRVKLRESKRGEKFLYVKAVCENLIYGISAMEEFYERNSRYRGAEVKKEARERLSHRIVNVMKSVLELVMKQGIENN